MSGDDCLLEETLESIRREVERLENSASCLTVLKKKITFWAVLSLCIYFTSVSLISGTPVEVGWFLICKTRKDHFKNLLWQLDFLL